MRVFYNYKIVNKERLKDLGSCLIAANHISATDPPFIGSIIPIEINYLAKIELFKKKIAATFFHYVNVIPVRRGVADFKAINTVKEKLNKGQAVLVFPEGTRKNVKAKAGIGKLAIETGKDILPIRIKNSDDFFNCLIRKKRVEIVIGEMIDVSPFIKEKSVKQDYRDLAAYVMKRINEL